MSTRYPTRQTNSQQQGLIHLHPDEVFAGFWRRAAAHIVDGLFVLLICLVVALLVGFVVGLMLAAAQQEKPSFLWPALFGFVMATVIRGMYYAHFHQSLWQATLGKRLLGIKVLNTDGTPLTYRAAVMRWLASALSALTWLGYVLAGFAPKKQSMHDMVCQTVVVHKHIHADDLASFDAQTHPTNTHYFWKALGVTCLLFLVYFVCLVAMFPMLAVIMGIMDADALDQTTTMQAPLASFVSFLPT